MVPEPLKNRRRGIRMRKLLFVVTMMILTLGLVACSGTETEEKSVDNVDLSDGEEAEAAEEDEDTAEEEATEEEADDEEVHEFYKEVIDNDDITAHLVSVEKIVDHDWDEEKYEITFEVENKRDSTIVVQAREVSSDGKMMDESMLMMSQEVSSGKLADAVLTIQNYDGDLPEIEEDLEMILHVFDMDDYEYQLDVDVKIEF